MSEYISDPELLAQLEGNKKKSKDSKGYITDPSLLSQLNAKTKPETALQTFGRSAASIPDTALNLVTGALDYGAYNLARAAGLSPEEAQRQTTSPKDVIGRALGVAGTPGYENAPQRQLGNYLGKTLSEGIINPLTEATGLPEQDVGSMFNSLTMAVPGMAKGGIQAVKPAFKATKDVVSGAVGRGTGYIAKPGEAPVGYQIPSSRAPLRDTVMLPEDVARFERGEMPYGQMPTEVPIQQLPRNALERTALKMSGGDIPYQGKAATSFGERIGETYRNPLTAAIDIGSLFTTGVPLMTAARGGLAGVQGIADAVLARRGLDPNLPTRLAEYQSGVRPMPGTPPAPVAGPVTPASINYPLTVQGPGQQLPPTVMTAPDLSRRVNIEGQPFNLPSQINVSNSQSARPQTPAQQSQQLAAQKLQQMQPAAQPTMPAVTSAPAQTPAPVVKQPVATPKAKTQTTTRSSSVINKELTDLDNQMTNLRDDALENRLTPDTPEGQAYSNQLNEMSIRAKSLQAELELAKKAEKKAGKQPKTLEEKLDVVKSQGEDRRNQARGKPDVLEMQIAKEDLPKGISSLSKEVTGEIYPSKEAYDKAMTFKILQEDITRASYIEGDKLITVFPQNIPKDLMRMTGTSPTAKTIRDVKTGKVIKD